MDAGRMLAAATVLLLTSAAFAGEVARDGRVELGRKLFEENWLRPPADGSPLAVTTDGDGLGPLFNGASCVECHFLGRVGGAGTNEHNVEIVSLALPLDAPIARFREAMRQARKTHPDFLRHPNVFLHRFGRDETGSLRRYDEFREVLRSEFPQEILPAGQTERVLTDGLPYQLAQRNTPALFGAGLIESITPEVVRGVAEEQQRRFPELAGLATDGGAGRYGWRGHMPTLARFVRTACADELGMRVRGEEGGLHDQPAWPVGGRTAVPRTLPRVDLADGQVEALVAFVRSLPRPEQVPPQASVERAAAEEGRRHFDRIGCAVCHVADMGPVRSIYSDMLLHDMGPAFADRVAAPLDLTPPQVHHETHVRAVRSTALERTSYAGVSPVSVTTLVPTTTTTVLPPSLGDLTKATQAFRTPALWGVADSAPYLHDGRAETLDDAIRLHGGQAAPVTAKYTELPERDRAALLAFLGTLRAPQTNLRETNEPAPPESSGGADGFSFRPAIDGVRVPEGVRAVSGGPREISSSGRTVGGV